MSFQMIKVENPAALYYNVYDSELCVLQDTQMATPMPISRE